MRQWRNQGADCGDGLANRGVSGSGSVLQVRFKAKTEGETRISSSELPFRLRRQGKYRLQVLLKFTYQQ